MSLKFWSTRSETTFDQKPRYTTRPVDSIRYLGQSHNMAAFRFLLGLCMYRYRLEKSGRPIPITWLLPFRDDFRELLQHNNANVVKSFLEQGGPTLRHVFIWLLSKFASRFYLLGIDTCWEDESRQVRKHLAKALRQLGHKELLGRMISRFPGDDTIWEIAALPLQKRSFAEKLRKFTADVDDSHAAEVSTPSRMPYWAHESDWIRTPPKSVEMIRRMLRRIQHWVRWGTT